MLTQIKRPLQKIYRRFFYQRINFDILANQYGQKQSILKEKCIDRAGKVIPWYTYPTIEYLKSFNFSQKSIFEYGAGYSSMFWAERAKDVVSVENDAKWFQHIDAIKKVNQKIILSQTADEYVQTLSKEGKEFDVIVIDGRWRNLCAREAMKYLKENGMIIFDNTDWHPNTSAMLRKNGFFQMDFSGFGPINKYCWTTSIFLPFKTKWQIDYQNPLPIGGIIEKNNNEDAVLEEQP